MNEPSEDQPDLSFGTERRMVLAGLMALPVAAQAAGASDAASGTGVGAALYEGHSTGFEGKTAAQILQELVDREQIRELIARYAQRVAHGMSNADLFTEDGVFITRYPDGRISESRGRAAIARRWGGPPAARADPSLPMIHNHIVRINGDDATGICSNELRRTENGRSMIGSGYYQDRYRRENGQWKFVERDMTFFHWVPIQQGWAEKRAAANDPGAGGDA